MTDSTVAVLRELLAQPGEEHHQADLAHAAGVPPATVRMTVARLVAFGWAVKAGDAAGASPIKLTADGVLGATVAVSRLVRRAQLDTADGPPVTVSDLAEAVRRGDESPAVLAAVQRALNHPNRR